MRKLGSLQELKIYIHNMDKFRVPKDQPSLIEIENQRRMDIPPKSTELINLEATRIRQMNPDIILASEVINVESFSNFNDQYLSGLYEPLASPGNDQYGSVVGFWVKRDLPLKFEYVSNSNRTRMDVGGTLRYIHTRDVPVLLVRPLSAPENSRPVFALFGVHAKAKERDAVANQIAESEARLQFRDMADIAKNLLERFPNLPFVLAGDFNRRAYDEAVNPLLELGLSDGLDLVAGGTDQDQKATFVNFNPYSGEPNYIQMDVVLAPRFFGRFLKYCKVAYPKDENGKDLPLPKTRSAAQEYGSRHFPIFLGLKFQLLYQNFVEYGRSR